MVPSAFWKLNSEAQASNYLMGFAGMHFIIKAMAICPWQGCSYNNLHAYI